MYGLINNALQDMIVKHFGDEQWKAIHSHAGIEEDSFLTMQSYDDSSTYKLAGAASELLATPLDDCLEMFGKHWVSDIATKNFGALMDATGNDTLTFLRNVNALHDRITSTFLDYIPPEFELEELDPQSGRYHVHYHSERKGLSHFVTGLLHGLAAHFGDNLQIHSVTVNDEGEGTHSVFELTVT